MKTIVFLHGFGSSGATKTADYLREKLTDTVVIQGVGITYVWTEGEYLHRRVTYGEV
jgi:hypothetical protein